MSRDEFPFPIVMYFEYSKARGKKRKWFDWNGLPICTVSVEGLIEMKRTAGRDQDLIDIKNLGFGANEK